MNKLIAVALKWSGFGWIWTKLDGKKTYLAGGAKVLSGLAILLGEVVATKDMAGLVELGKNLPNDPGAQLLLLGLGVLGIGHKLDKQAEAPEVAK